MRKKRFLAAFAATLLGTLAFVHGAVAEETSQPEFTKTAMEALDAAQVEIDAAREALEQGKVLMATIPADSPLMADVAEVIQAASENWKVAVESLQGAKDSAARIESANSDAVAKDFALLARVNAGVALSGAKVVQIAMTYVEAISSEKTEALDMIRGSLQDALASSSQVQFNYDRLKTLIAQKYAK